MKAATNAAKYRKGALLSIINKFTDVDYMVDVQKLDANIHRCLVHSVEKGVLVRIGDKVKKISFTHHPN